jgi:hypothetical protein
VIKLKVKKTKIWNGEILFLVHGENIFIPPLTIYKRKKTITRIELDMSLG